MQSLFRSAREAGEVLKVKTLAGIQVLVSSRDDQDLVRLQFGRRVFVDQHGYACFKELPEVQGCACGFVFKDGSPDLHLQDMPEGACVKVLRVEPIF